jgi:ABC-type polysaccharide/polyol phosphate export permease
VITIHYREKIEYETGSTMSQRQRSMQATRSPEGVARTRLSGKWPERCHQAIVDLVQGLRQHELWLTMGLQDLRRRYRRSILGPLWLTLSLVILVAFLGALYGRLMRVSAERYVPHVALGFIAWQFIHGTMSSGCNVFIRNKGWIINVRTPLALFVFRMVWEHLIMMGHNASVYIGVAVFFSIHAGAVGLLILPAVVLLMANAIWVGLLFGTLCARFRDIPQIVESLMRVAFFITPVIWMPDQLGEREYLAFFNPFTYFVELVRAPLIGKVPSARTWGLALTVSVSGWALAGLVFARFRARVPYWL